MTTQSPSRRCVLLASPREMTVLPVGDPRITDRYRNLVPLMVCNRPLTRDRAEALKGWALSAAVWS